MWDASKSTMLSIVCTRTVIVLAIACAVAIPFLYSPGYLAKIGILEDESGFPLPFVFIYLSFIPELVALLSLDRLLCAIRRGETFTHENVRRLRLISWMCFAAAAVLLCGFYVRIAFVLTAVLISFVGLILRVVKNVIEAAVLIKDENDFTI